MSEGPSPEQQGADLPVTGRPPSAAAPNAGQASASPPASGEAVSSRACESCGAPLKPGQDWCLQCGAGADSSSTGPGWRTAAAVIGASAVLALGAAAAAYAAFKEGSPPPTTPVSTVAQTPPATTTTTTTTSSTATAATTTGSGLPATASKPPKIPAHEGTPASGGTTSKTSGQSEPTPEHGGSKVEGSETKAHEGQSGTAKEDEEEACKAAHSAEGESSTGEEGTGSSTETTTTTQTSSTESEQAEAEACEEGTHGAKPAPILLEAEDASTYNPNAYPATDFASPELAIDGVATTAWTAAPAPGLAPKVQAGLLLDLEGERQIAKVGLISRTLGMTVQIYGTTQRKPPKSITASRWEKLSGVHLVEQRSSTLTLRHTPKIRQLLVWVLRAPEVEPEVEGEAVEESAAINEVALYEPK